MLILSKITNVPLNPYKVFRTKAKETLNDPEPTALWCPELEDRAP